MKYKLYFQLVGLPKSLNGSHGHWKAKTVERKRWRNLSCNVASLNKPKAPLKKCSLECVRFSSNAMDYDNLVASFKAVVDGLKDAGIIEDDNSNVIIYREYRHEKAKKNEGRVSVCVTELSEGGSDV